jgi:hypothetical protein
MRKLVIAAVCGLAMAVTASTPAWAYDRARGTGKRVSRVVTAAPLTVTGTQASFAGNSGVGSTVPVTPTISNPNAFRYWAHSVTATVTGSSKCVPSDYSVQGSPKAVQQAVPRVGTGTLAPTGISVVRVSGSCKNDTVTLTYTVT